MSNMNAIAEFGKSLMAFANLFTVLIFFQAAWGQEQVATAALGLTAWFLAHCIGMLMIAISDFFAPNIL